MQILPCTPEDRAEMFAIVNDSATAYRGTIPPTCGMTLHAPRGAGEEGSPRAFAFWKAVMKRADSRLLGDTGCVGRDPLSATPTFARRARAMARRDSSLTSCCHASKPVSCGTAWKLPTGRSAIYEKHGF
jgi:hypothetical protein